MALTASFLTTCRAAVLLRAEHAAFQAARAAFAAAGEDERQARWNDCFGDGQTGLSPAYRLRRAVRETIAASADTTLSQADRESAYQQLTAELGTDTPAPEPPTVRTPALTAEDLDLARIALARLAAD